MDGQGRRVPTTFHCCVVEDAPVKPVLYWSERLDETWIGAPIKSIGFGITGGGQDD